MTTTQLPKTKEKAVLIHLQGKYNNLVMLVDEEDYNLVSKYKWYCGNTHQSKYYAYTRFPKQKKFTYAHRFIMNTPKGFHTDHISGNTLDNRRCNLRVCSSSENIFHKQATKTSKSSSKYHGVMFDKSRNKYRARIIKNGKEIHIGRFEKESDAANAWNIKALELYGEFAILNKLGDPNSCLNMAKRRFDNPKVSPSLDK